MTELITAVQDYAVWLYAFLGVLIIREFGKIVRAGRERRQAMFVLEREAATGKATRSLVVILQLVTIAIGIYTTARIIAPALPERERRLALEDAPIIDPPQSLALPTDTPRIRRRPSPKPPRIVTAPPEETRDSQDDESAAPSAGALCRNPDVTIESPGPGAVLTGPTPIMVTARFARDSGRRYVLELGRGADPSEWTQLVEPRAEPVTEGVLVTLDTAALESGVYTLRLTLYGAPEGDLGAGGADDEACTISVRIP